MTRLHAKLQFGRKDKNETSDIYSFRTEPMLGNKRGCHTMLIEFLLQNLGVCEFFDRHYFSFKGTIVFKDIQILERLSFDSQTKKNKLLVFLIKVELPGCVIDTE